MSLDLFFNKPIPSKEDLFIKNIKITNKGDSSFLEDQYSNTAYIKSGLESDENLELTFYGTSNPTKILDTLVYEFGMKFFTDDFLQEAQYNQDISEHTFNKCMEEYGYLKDGKLITVIRSIEDFNKN